MTSAAIFTRTPRGSDAGAFVAAGPNPRAGPKTQTARVRRRRSLPAAWTFARVPGRPSCGPRWGPSVSGARSGRERCGRLHRASRRAVQARRVGGQERRRRVARRPVSSRHEDAVGHASMDYLFSVGGFRMNRSFGRDCGRFVGSGKTILPSRISGGAPIPVWSS